MQRFKWIGSGWPFLISIINSISVLGFRFDFYKLSFFPTHPTFPPFCILISTLVSAPQYQLQVWITMQNLAFILWEYLHLSLCLLHYYCAWDTKHLRQTLSIYGRRLNTYEVLTSTKAPNLNLLFFSPPPPSSTWIWNFILFLAPQYQLQVWITMQNLAFILW